jgi:hypothetical protein
MPAPGSRDEDWQLSSVQERVEGITLTFRRALKIFGTS